MSYITYSSFDELWRLISPPWLLRPWGEKLVTTFAAAQDEHHARSKASVKARFPTQAPGDALESIASDRGLPRAVNETLADWRARLASAWDLWPDAGTDRGILRALHWAGFDDCTAFPPYDPQDPSYVRDPAQTVIIATAYDLGAAGRPDAPNTSWSVFWVLVDGGANNINLDLHTWDDPTGWDTWGTGTDPDNWDDYGTWDFDEPLSTIEGWRSAIRTWKPAHALCPHILVFNGPSTWADIWGSFGAWGDPDEGLWNTGSDSASCVVGEAE